MNNKYIFPKGFDPYNAVHSLKAISYFLHDYYAEGPGVHRTVPEGHYANLLGIVALQQRVANELYDYIVALGEAGLDLPLSEDELEEVDIRNNQIREEHPLYLVSSSH